ncbi:MAG: methyl coenzyme M reductase system, component A2 [Candidatus Helarchaeota archaeon]|nr:methyl coenzyme M reductase system, component A2 [Candidatus Helarchaeota archaeon]
MSSEKKPFLEVKDVTVEFVRGEPSIRNISFTINEGHSFGILGKSGSGKSVLMNAIRGTKEFEPIRGEILFHLSYCPNCFWIEYGSKAGEACAKCGATLEYKNVNYWKERKEFTPLSYGLYNRISIMFQRSFALFGELPVMINLQRVLTKINYPQKLKNTRALQLLQQVKLEHRATHLARDLSGGEKQRSVFAMCLARDPLLFIADEPTGTLDPVTSVAVHDVMKKTVQEEGLTLLVTSHWPTAVVELSEEAILLENGEMISKGDPQRMADEFLEKMGEVVIDRRAYENPLIRINNCFKTYYTHDRGVVKAVNNISFNVMEGEIFGLVGVSGAGKTSLVQMLIGEKKITTGKIEVKIGDDWVDMSVPGIEERGRALKYMEILHQEYCLYPHLTVLDNLIGAIEQPMGEEMKTKKAYDALRGVNFTNKEIDNLIYKFPDNISEGERHRVAIGRVLIKEPKIVILDEPTGTADPLTRMEIVRSIKNARNNLNQSYMIISHDIDFIKAVCDRAVLMAQGKLMKLGDPDSVIDTFREIESKAQFHA